MRRSAIIILSWLFCLVFTVRADLSGPGLEHLRHKLSSLTAPYGPKVGLCFIDLKTGNELQINGFKRFPAASVAKVAVMATAFNLAEQGQLDLEKKVLFKESDKLDGAGVLRWLKGGRTYTLRNLIRLMIVLSDNTATKLVVEQLGYRPINDYLAEAGLAGIQVVDKTMLNEPTAEAVNLATPVDLAKLVRMIKEAGYFKKDSSAQMLAYMRNQKYRWGLWRGVPPGVQIANKTGHLDGVLNDVGVIYSPTGNYVLSVFTYGLPKKEARVLINKISTAAFESYTGIKVSAISSVKKRPRSGSTSRSSDRKPKRRSTST